MIAEEFTVEDNILLDEFADFVARNAGCNEEILVAAARLALGAVLAGHACCDLRYCGSTGKKIKEFADAENNGCLLPGTKMLLLDGDCLYLTKYSMFEEYIARELVRRKFAVLPAEITAEEINAVRNPEQPLAAAQMQACLSWLNSNFAIVTGGAGTGKTTISATAVACELLRNSGCRIVAATPTGKAKSRFLEALAEEASALMITEEIRARMLDIKCFTVESLSGRNRNRSRGGDEQEMLPVDLLILDECSMESLTGIYYLFAILPPGCRIVLLGDANQLFSVEAGSVFAELCASEVFKENITVLNENFRSRSNPYLVETAEKVCSMDCSADEKFSAFKKAVKDSHEDVLGIFGEFSFIKTGKNPGRQLPEIIKNIFARWEITAPADLQSALGSLEEYKILTPVREGDAGVQTCNRLVSELLGIKEGDDGYPVMILVNDKRTGLSNGDCGVFWQGRVYFPAVSGEGTISFSPVELPDWECAWCMSIHKSQGSGFKKVLVLLPDYGRKLLCCELFYTAVTRAKKHICIVGAEECVKQTFARRMMRFSGLNNKINVIAAEK